LKDDVLPYKDYVAFARHKPGVVFTAGGNRESWTNKRVTFVDPATNRLSALTGTNAAAGSLEWSPDGTRIVFSLGPDAGTVGGGEQAKNALAQRRIWVMNMDGPFCLSGWIVRTM
jgi:Tol biopolymer transport system component